MKYVNIILPYLLGRYDAVIRNFATVLGFPGRQMPLALEIAPGHLRTTEGHEFPYPEAWQIVYAEWHDGVFCLLVEQDKETTLYHNNEWRGTIDMLMKDYVFASPDLIYCLTSSSLTYLNEINFRTGVSKVIGRGVGNAVYYGFTRQHTGLMLYKPNLLLYNIKLPSDNHEVRWQINTNASSFSAYDRMTIHSFESSESPVDFTSTLIRTDKRYFREKRKIWTISIMLGVLCFHENVDEEIRVWGRGKACHTISSKVLDIYLKDEKFYIAEAEGIWVYHTGTFDNVATFKTSDSTVSLANRLDPDFPRWCELLFHHCSWGRVQMNQAHQRIMQQWFLCQFGELLPLELWQEVGLYLVADYYSWRQL